MRNKLKESLNLIAQGYELPPAIGDVLMQATVHKLLLPHSSFCPSKRTQNSEGTSKLCYLS